MNNSTTPTGSGVETLLLKTGSAAAVLADLLTALNGDDLPADRRARARAAVRQAQRPTVRWASPRPGEHVLDGQPLNRPLAGLDAAFAVFSCRHRIPAATFAAPGSRRPANAVRNAIRRATQLVGLTHPALAHEMGGIAVIEGMLVYRPQGAADVIIEAPKTDHQSEGLEDRQKTAANLV